MEDRYRRGSSSLRQDHPPAQTMLRPCLMMMRCVEGIQTAATRTRGVMTHSISVLHLCPKSHSCGDRLSRVFKPTPGLRRKSSRKVIRTQLLATQSALQSQLVTLPRSLHQQRYHGKRFCTFRWQAVPPSPLFPADTCEGVCGKTNPEGSKYSEMLRSLFSRASDVVHRRSGRVSRKNVSGFCFDRS